MRRESPFPMVPIDEARRLIMAHVVPLGVEQIDALSAGGRVLAVDICAPEPVPDVPKAAMDGFALRAADGTNPRKIVAELTAGIAPGLTIGPNEAAAIMTGAPMPDGADTMIPVEQTEMTPDGMLLIEQALQPGDYVHTVGVDIAVGALVLKVGTVLGPPEIGLLATFGITRVAAYRRPRVAVLATGDEVVEPAGARPPGAVRDSNRYALLAAAREAGAETLALGIAPDDADGQREAIMAGLAHADVLITSGGVSMGTRDLIKPILAALGSLHFGRIAFKPGKPTTFATIDRADGPPKLAFGLPGYPVSSLVSFEVFVRPALRALQGDLRPDRPLVQVALAAPIKPSPDRPEYQRVQIRWQDGRLTASSTGVQGSSRLLSLHGANGLLLVPPGNEVYAAGATLDALLTGPILAGD